MVTLAVTYACQTSAVPSAGLARAASDQLSPPPVTLVMRWVEPLGPSAEMNARSSSSPVLVFSSGEVIRDPDVDWSAAASRSSCTTVVGVRAGVDVAGQLTVVGPV